jgi:hypothetical protein
VSLGERLEATVDAASGRRILEKLAAELARRGITEEEIGRLARVSMWQGMIKNKEDEAEIHDLYGFQLHPTWDEGPQWPVVQPAAPVRVAPTKRTTPKGDVRTTVILPDPQIGFRRIGTELIRTHDAQAMDVSLVVAVAARPDRIVNLGDFEDFAEWSSKFLVTPEFVETTQPALDEGHRFLARQKAICETVDLLEGNHDDRLAIAVASNAMAALRLRPAATPPDHWPVLSIPNLLRLDDLGVTYHDGYPANRTKLTRGTDEQTPLVAIHGDVLDIVKLAKMSRQSYVQGHIHRRAMHCETFEVDGQPLVVQAFSPGCLCRIDGAVPSTKSAKSRQRPVERWENWQQGMAVVTEHEDGSWGAEIVPIHRGQALWRGKAYEAA